MCILLLVPEYSLDIQAQIPAALCAIHNFMCLHDPSEDTVPSESSSEMKLCGDENPDYQRQADDEDIDNGSSCAMRECIAQEMWDQYQGICHIPYIRASHPKFRMSDPIRSDQIRSTDLYRIHHDKLLHSYPVHITLNTAYFLHLVYPPFRCIGYAFFRLCLLIRFTCDYLPAYD